MKAREIMTSNPECVTRDDTLARAAQIMRDLNVGIVPVVDDRSTMRLTGLITDRDIAIRHVADGHPDSCSVGDHMTTDGIRRVAPDDDLDQVVDAMRGHQVRRIPVVEPGERLVGIIAQADLAIDAGDDRTTGETVQRISEPAHPTR